MDSPDSITETLLREVPVVQGMCLRCSSYNGQELELVAPLKANLNNKAIAFGGSLSTLAILSAWTLLLVRLKDEGSPCRIVIQRNSVEYKNPVKADFFARSSVEEKDWKYFKTMLERKGIGRITISCIITSAGESVGSFNGTYVASPVT